MIVPRFTIDMSECMYCDLCVHPCPEECIYMVGGPNEPKHEIDYEFSQYERHGLVFEFATATEEDIIDIGGEDYLADRKAKEEKRKKGENLQGAVASEISSGSALDGEESKKEKHKDPLLEIFNIVPDKVARGIAKKAVVFGKRSGFDFPRMAKEVDGRISKAGKTSAEMSKALENLQNYVAEEKVSSAENEEDIKPDESISANDSNEEILEFNVKSLNFIEDKMARGIAKKSFMASKRAKLDTNSMVDAIIKDLKENSKLDDDTNNSLLAFKSDSSSVKDSTNVKEEKPDNKVATSLFDIKLLNELDDKVIRGSSKKIYMAGKRGNKSSEEVIKDILNELSDKLDDKSKALIEGLK